MQTMYVTAHPTRAQFAAGYITGLPEEDDDLEPIHYELVLREDVPLDKVYLTGEPIPSTPAPE